MTSMPSTDLQSRVAAIRWYHTIDLGGGVVTHGVDDSPVRLARAQLPASLQRLDGPRYRRVGWLLFVRM